MHPTLFELNAFGRSRLPGAQGRTVLRHLRQGCARCQAALSAHLIRTHGPTIEGATEADRSFRRAARRARIRR